ncbi:PaeR7I family type II restriction endonuclease [Myxococcota bacterium]|nr:PaeR7I family type II restriction endonuclease [Myxococcota bacterium]
MDKHRVEQAVRFFWETRTQQQQAQGRTSGRRDSGNRRAVTGGRHLDGFANLLVDLLCESGLPREAIHTTATTLPGYFRPTKDWDLVVTAFEEFRDSSYARRYELFCERLVRERLYDRACLLLSEQESGLQGVYREPNQGFGFTAFATSLCAHTTAYIASFRK